MSNVWKIGSRWGYPGTSILDVFLSYNCVFFNTDETSKIGDYMSVKYGDLFIVADGETPVAIAKALDSFKKYEESGLLFTSQDKDEYIYEKVLLCKVSIILLGKEERKTWGFMNQNRFCAYRPHDLAQRELVFKYWEEHQSKNEHGVFDIVCGTYSLLENTKDAVYPIGWTVFLRLIGVNVLVCRPARGGAKPDRPYSSGGAGRVLRSPLDFV